MSSAPPKHISAVSERLCIPQDAEEITSLLGDPRKDVEKEGQYVFHLQLTVVTYALFAMILFLHTKLPFLVIAHSLKMGASPFNSLDIK